MGRQADSDGDLQMTDVDENFEGRFVMQTSRWLHIRREAREFNNTQVKKIYNFMLQIIMISVGTPRNTVMSCENEPPYKKIFRRSLCFFFHYDFIPLYSTDSSYLLRQLE